MVTTEGKPAHVSRDNEDFAVSRGVSLGGQRLAMPVASALFAGNAGAYGGYFPKPKSSP